MLQSLYNVVREKNDSTRFYGNQVRYSAILGRQTNLAKHVTRFQDFYPVVTVRDRNSYAQTAAQHHAQTTAALFS